MSSMSASHSLKIISPPLKNVKEQPIAWIEQFRTCIPPLNGKRHVGDSGRIGIIGGCEEYTGAPYYAGMTSLRCGADLVHIFSTPSAAQAIKCYGPEVIVHGVLTGEDLTKYGYEWLNRLHCLVLGPGLGRNPKVIASATSLIKCARNLKIPLVVDADGLWMVLQKPELIKAWPLNRAVLTPNIVEFSRLANKNGVATVEELARLFGTTIVLKGKTDYVSSCRGEVRVCKLSGSGRRCGGQGDILSGALGIFLFWTCRAKDESGNCLPYDPTLVASYSACRLTRECNCLAFLKKGRSTLTSDMIDEVHGAFTLLFSKSGETSE